MIHKLKESVRIKLKFYPGPLGILMNPFYIARTGLLRELKALSHFVHGRVLDVGCGQKPYMDLFKFDEYIGLELDTPENRQQKKADIYYDGTNTRLADNSFDVVFLSQVFEHIFNPETFLKELHRVLKQGGGVLITVPFVWDEHEQPCDYARYSSFGLHHLLESHGFKVLEQKKTVADIRVIFQLINTYFYKVIKIKNPYLRYILYLLIMAPSNITGELLGIVLPGNKDLYLDNVVFARKEV